MQECVKPIDCARNDFAGARRATRDRVLSFCYQKASPEDAMAQVLIRNLDDAVVARLKARAKANGRSLQKELQQIISQAAPEPPMSADEVDAFFARIRAANKPNTKPLTLDEIREGLE
jgi:plasmid stability protein